MKHIYSENSTSSLTNVQPNDVQPNAVDLRLDRVFKYTDSVVFIIDEETKIHRSSVEIEPNQNNFFLLLPGSYEIIFQNVISVGEHEAGWVVTRSTLNRNGLYITSGLYDSGYHGAMAGCLHVTGGGAFIRKGTRVAQFLLFDAEMLKKYNGDYGLDSNGKLKEMEKKYHG